MTQALSSCVGAGFRLSLFVGAFFSPSVCASESSCPPSLGIFWHTAEPRQSPPGCATGGMAEPSLELRSALDHIKPQPGASVTPMEKQRIKTLNRRLHNYRELVGKLRPSACSDATDHSSAYRQALVGQPTIVLLSNSALKPSKTRRCLAGIPSMARLSAFRIFFQRQLQLHHSA